MMDEQKKIFFYYQPLYSYSDLFYLSGNETCKFNGNPLQYSCLENPMEDPGRLQSMGSQESNTTE